MSESDALPQRSARRRAINQAPPTEDDDRRARHEAETSTESCALAAVPVPGLTETADDYAPVFRARAVGEYKFEYLDHPADIQIHSWGETLEEAFEYAALAMFNYMTPLDGVEAELARDVEVEGRDAEALLFTFLDELLFLFHTELFACKELAITSLMRGERFKICAEARGERFDRARHAIGTEVKAITYSAMQIVERPGNCDVFVIVDI